MARKFRVGSENFFDHRGHLHMPGDVVTWPDKDDASYNPLHHEPPRGFGWTQVLSPKELAALPKDVLDSLQEGQNEIPVPPPERPSAAKDLAAKVEALSPAERAELAALLNPQPMASRPSQPAVAAKSKS